jgi:hypothetical protein
MTNWRERRQGVRARARPNKHEKTGEAAAPAVTVAGPIIFCLKPAAHAHAEAALEALAALVKEASSEHVRVAAANAILDRAFGKPLTGARAAAEEDGEGEDGPIEVRWLGQS